MAIYNPAINTIVIARPNQANTLLKVFRLWRTLLVERSFPYSIVRGSIKVGGSVRTIYYGKVSNFRFPRASKGQVYPRAY